jgi:hypothetical protein
MMTAKTIGQWLFRLFPAGALLVLMVAIVSTHYGSDHRADKFIKHWVTLFQACRNTTSIRALPPAEHPDSIFIRDFTNGQWIAVRSESDCTTGAGFDASVFADSDGNIKHQKGHHFCGYEGLSCELSKVSARNLAEFYGALTNIQFQTAGGEATIR